MPTSESQLATLYQAGGWQSSAEADYNTFCMPCHAVDGGGGIGPNFTDDYIFWQGHCSSFGRNLEPRLFSLTLLQPKSDI